MKNINFVLIGAGDFGGEVGSYVKDIENDHIRTISFLFDSGFRTNDCFKFLGYIDDNPETWGKEIYGKKILGNMDFIKTYPEPIYFTVTIGAPVIRKIVAERAEALGYIPLSIISPDFRKREDVEIGKGSIILPGVVFTNGQKLGKYCHIHECVAVGHKVTLGDYGTLAPSATIFGGCEIGEGTYIGGNSTLLQFVKVGKWSIIGAGAVVLKDVPDLHTYVGNPAHKIKDFGTIGNRKRYRV